jgi:hypothetical protein
MVAVRARDETVESGIELLALATIRCLISAVVKCQLLDYSR